MKLENLFIFFQKKKIKDYCDVNLLLQKGSFIIPADMGSIKLLKIIQIYKTKKNKHAIFGKFFKAVLKSVMPKLLKIRKKKTKGIVIRSNIFFLKKDGLLICFFKNAVIPLKKRMNP